jgi:hypothetical protein
VVCLKNSEPCLKISDRVLDYIDLTEVEIPVAQKNGEGYQGFTFK